MSTSINTIDGNWHHICFTSNGSTVTLYVDGIQQSQITDASTTAMTSNKFFLTANNYNLNDFRLYDHVLSPKEVKEIAKGLVLHYPLSRPQENLLLNTGAPISWTTSHTNDDQWSVKDIYKMQSPVNQLFATNDLVTFSFDWEYTPGSSGIYSGNMHTEVGNTTPWSIGSVYYASGFRATNSNYVDFSETNCKGHCWIVYTVSSAAATAADGFQWFRIRWDKTPQDGTLTFSHCKLERGAAPTPWIPNSADTAYSVMGYNDNIEYDCSGYKYNGTKSGTITYTADTPRYFTSTNFGGISYITNNTSPLYLANEFTIAWWGKINSWKKNWEGMFLLQNNTNLNAGLNTYDIMSAAHASTSGVMALTICQNGSSYIFDRYNWTYTIGNWAHYACTYKNGAITMYQNGISIYTETITNGSANNYYYQIGRRAANCDCNVSDFRIYATALSAEDIKELYNAPVSITNNGTMLT